MQHPFSYPLIVLVSAGRHIYYYPDYISGTLVLFHYCQVIPTAK